MIELQKGDIVAVFGTSFISDIVEAVEHSSVSHVAVVVDPEKEILIEANYNHPVSYVPLNQYKGVATILRTPLTEEQKDFIVDYLTKQIGKQYDFIDIIREFGRYIFGITPKKEDERFFICSTLVQMAFLHAGVVLTKEPLASPADLYESHVVTKIGWYE
jgi:uncharacterized protein YycO